MFLNIGAARPHREQRPAEDWLVENAGVRTVINPDLTVVGHLLTDGHIQVEGRVEGTINSHSVTVREGGYVEGTILADTAYVYGTVVGPVRANTVLVGSRATVIGNIFHHTLTIEPGAYLEGRRPWRPHIDRTLESA